MRRPRKLTIDVGPLFETTYTGIPVFTRRLISALLRYGSAELSFSFRMTEIPAEPVLSALRIGDGRYLRADFERHAFTAYRPIDRESAILFPTVKEFVGISQREASVVHDLSTLFLRDTHNPSNIEYHLGSLKANLIYDERIFCISEATRSAVAETFPSSSPKLSVMLQYVDWPDVFEDIARNTQRASRRYALVIGTIEPRKNLSLLLNLVSTREFEALDLDIVVIGGRRPSAEEPFNFAGPLIDRRVHRLNYVSEFRKYCLLRDADYLIFPSLYEGFGIPALEAMSLGKPVLASRTSSLPEVVGDAGLFFDPFSPTELLAGMREMISADLRRELSERALRRSREFDGRRMIAPVLEWLQDG